MCTVYPLIATGEARESSWNLSVYLDYMPTKTVPIQYCLGFSFKDPLVLEIFLLVPIV